MRQQAKPSLATNRLGRVRQAAGRALLVLVATLLGMLLVVGPAQGREADFAGDPEVEIISLAGPWRVTTQALEPPAALRASLDDWDRMSLPSLQAGDHEVVWFGADVQLTEPDRWSPKAKVAVALPPFIGAYEAYANGRRIGGSGQPPPGAKWGSYRHQAYPLQAPDVDELGLLRLRVRVWPHGWGHYGTSDATSADGLAVGSHDLLADRMERLLRQAEGGLLYHWSVAWLLLGLGLVFLAFAARVRGQREYAYLTLLVLGLAAERLLASWMDSGASDDPRTLYFLMLVVRKLLLVVLVLLITGIFQVQTKASRVVVAILALATVIPIVGWASNGLYNDLAWTDRLGIALMVPYLLFVVVKRARNRDPDARLLGGAFGVALVILVVAFALTPWASERPSWELAVNLLIDLSVACIVGAMALLLARRQQRTRDELLASFAASQRFVPFDFLELLGRRNITEVQRADATALDMGILFADIRGFTTRCEQHTTDENFAFINRYLERTEPAVVEQGGFIHKYLGDGVVALFPGGGADALRAASRMQEAVRVLNGELVDQGEEPIRVGIGVHHDRVMLGTIGGERQLDAGVISDGVNLTARIESLTKTYRASVLVSGAVAELAEDAPLREIDTVVVKGRSQPAVLLQALDALEERERDGIEATAEAYQQGLTAYRSGEFAEAQAQFEACDEDEPAAVMAVRCGQLTASQVDDWQGVTVLDHK